MIGAEKPSHPLISVIESSRREPLATVQPIMNVTFVSDLYSISLKNGRECGIKYGRMTYDFQEGSLMFVAPHQAVTPVTEPGELEAGGESWTLVFHPDLIRKNPLSKRMKDYSFFTYESHEALHISERERQTVNGIVDKIREEYSQNLDEHSQDLIVANIELLLNYCRRYYGRQFLTRSHVNKDVVVRLETWLREYFDSNKPEEAGIPSVRECAEQMGYSANYLSDLLKKETGRNTRQHIHDCLMERAKDLLLGSEDTVSQIAYALGFEYPGHFSRLFKSKIGKSPLAYRTELPMLRKDGES
jgi:AraC family transcriptional regulator, transcriptional activator of pobA